MNKTLKLRQMLKGDGIIVLPGIYDCLSAKIAKQAGFEAVFTSGFGISAVKLGMPDYGLITASEMMESLENIAKSVNIPVVADMDTGYGNPLNVTRTVAQAVKAGVAGVILEDQQWPKKCGHMEGKRVIPAADHVQKIKAAREAGGSDLLIIARTDSRAELGLDEAIKRGHEYKAAGADVIFIEAPQSLEELGQIVNSFPDVPLVANMVEGGKTPIMTADKLGDLGFKIVVYPVSGLFAAASSVMTCFKYLKENKTTQGYKNDFSFSDFEKLIDLPKYKEIESKFSS
ncbi:MAG: isocitrate lyase/PEP mutase family protein [Candidatus Dadabacteria bacterium]|nr:isocitrate lyase/PEP mutase family protein [Candidatus Dadabacteria bacterium]NIS09601.1 isocitrate lyase/PEP mutase family protein [Candidatus Dadabacteria bacterium]NIV43180.1 carboxyvinyl-carboxyphosphonate phosphorylmutase [Candidatus Dadabacteria bacterium]NIX16083.1 carboxyvinyl-carboxyphosphonate phosphorylmutase [Candidatus Dadabacteria bacterium]NIY22773.1 carboxyvinyl-carboxyphosphonate phosphorylmutase [Candidatus Dadabacteria bacterium]